MKKVFLALIATAAVLSARLSDFEVNKIQKAGAEGRAYDPFGSFDIDELQKSCNKGDAAGCTRLGLAYHLGRGVRQDYKKANELFSKSCDLEFGSGCYNLGILYTNGQGVKQDKSMAKEYFGKACDLGDQIGCDEYKKLNEQGF